MAGRRPLLSDYPHLHQILKNDPVANQQFNAALSGLVPAHTATRETQLQTELETARKKVISLEAQIKKDEATKYKQASFIKLLGDAVESQVQLDPYAKDINTGRKYNIEFTPDQVRVAMRLHWDLIAGSMETEIARVVSISSASPLELDGEEDAS